MTHFCFQILFQVTLTAYFGIKNFAVMLIVTKDLIAQGEKKVSIASQGLESHPNAGNSRICSHLTSASKAYTCKGII